MVRRTEVFRGVAVQRSVATADVAAGKADAKVDPRRADLQTIFASARGTVHAAGRRFGHMRTRVGKIDAIG